MKFDAERCNERSAMTLIALTSLKLGESWSEATNNMLGIRAIMDWIDSECKIKYAANTCEEIRRFTLHQFDEAGLVEQNADFLSRPTNSPRWNYRITEIALKVIRSFGTDNFEQVSSDFFSERPSWKEKQIAIREMHKVSVSLPNGCLLRLSSGGQNNLIKSIVEEFCPRFAPGGEILLLDETTHKSGINELDKFSQLDIVIPKYGKTPDLVVWRADKRWLYLIEACSSHGPIDVTRKQELLKLFDKQKDCLIFVSCFPDRKVMKRYLEALAWETVAWCADSPDHLIHFNGSKFLGPHNKG